MELGILLIAVFLLELLGLFFTSRFLTESLTRLIHSHTRSVHKTIHLLAFIFLPGTIIHELSHLITAGVMLVEVGDIEFLPEVKEDRVKLGSAQIGRTDPVRRALIGIAPVLVGISLIVGMLFYFFSHFSTFSGIGWVLLLVYLLFELSNTMFSSSKDMEGFALFLGLIMGLGVALGATNLVNFSDLANKALTEQVVSFIKQLDLTLLMPLVVDLLIYLLIRLLSPLRNQRY